jgi:hypothetical protein
VVDTRSSLTPAAGRVITQPQPRRQPAASTRVRRFTLLASGDVLSHTSVVERARAYGAGSRRAFDFRPMFAAIRPIVSAADLAVCHLETPLSPSGRQLSGYPRFNAPPQLAAAIRHAGYDACSVASNHSMDRGPHGVAGTLAVLDRAGLRHAGMARSPREGEPSILTVRGVRVALLSYTYGLNGFQVPSQRPWLVNLLNPDRILADARAARRAGSEFTVVFLHWGQEYRSAPTKAQRALAARLLTDPSVDLIVGHHAHVVQPVQRLHGKWVAFGMATPCRPNQQLAVLRQLRTASSFRSPWPASRTAMSWRRSATPRPGSSIRATASARSSRPWPVARPAQRYARRFAPRCTAQQQPSGGQRGWPPHNHNRLHANSQPLLISVSSATRNRTDGRARQADSCLEPLHGKLSGTWVPDFDQ